MNKNNCLYLFHNCYFFLQYTDIHTYTHTVNQMSESNSTLLSVVVPEITNLMRDPIFWVLSFFMWAVLGGFVFALYAICYAMCNNNRRLTEEKKGPRIKVNDVKSVSLTYTIDEDNEDLEGIDGSDSETSNTVGFDEETHEEEFHKKPTKKKALKKTKTKQQMHGTKQKMQSIQSQPSEAVRYEYEDDEDDLNTPRDKGLKTSKHAFGDANAEDHIELDLESIKD